MADDSLVTVRDINWREAFAFTHLFRSFRIAVHPSKLVLGLLLLLMLYIGGRVLDAVWSNDSKANFGEVTDYELYRYRHDPAESFEAQRQLSRGQHINDYADRLQSAGIVSDREQAIQAARHGEYLSELEGRQIGLRNLRIEHDRQVRDKAMQAADADVKDEAPRRRLKHDLELAYNKSVLGEDEQAWQENLALRRLVPRGIFDEFFAYQIAQVTNTSFAVLNGHWVGESDGSPTAASTVFRSVTDFLIVGPSWLLRVHPFYCTLFTIWFLIMWAIFGGAIARIAAVHVARDEKISVRQALTFSFNKVLSFVFAPIIPLLIVLVAGATVAIGGLIYYIPWIGPIIAGIFFVLALVAGFVMTLVALGTLGGFNLMYPTIGVEGSDSFDAISRSFSYVFARPWRMVFYTLVAVAYGAICYLFVRYFIYVLLSLTHFFVSWFLGGQPGRYFPDMWPTPQVNSLIYSPNLIGLKWSEAAGAVIMSFWIYLVISMLGAFAISYYFSSNTVIYYLMRREVDATELDDVYVEDADEEFADAPVTSDASAPAAGDVPPSTAAASSAPTVVVVERPDPSPPDRAPDAGAPGVS